MEKKPNYMTVPTALKELEKIEKTEADVIAAKKRCDHATAGLKELLDKRDAIRKDEILSAIVKSGRSYEEIMNFLNVEDTESETKTLSIYSQDGYTLYKILIY